MANPTANYSVVLIRVVVDSITDQEEIRVTAELQAHGIHPIFLHFKKDIVFPDITPMNGTS